MRPMEIPPQDKNEILDLLSNFIEYFNQDKNEISPLINLAVLYPQFENIHTFYDGNSRTGKILKYEHNIPKSYFQKFCKLNWLEMFFYSMLNLLNVLYLRKLCLNLFVNK